MKLKKMMAALLGTALLASMLAACGNDGSSAANTTDTADTPAADTNDTAADAADEDAGDTDADAPAADGDLPYAGITLTIMKDGDSADAGMYAVAARATEVLGMDFEFETRVSGAEGDNLVKTRLASGEMTDILMYNPGSLLMALNPSEYFIDISAYDFVNKLDDTYRAAVSDENGVYGVPFGSATVGAVLYNKTIYADLGLDVPHTWDDFLANCEAIAAAGIDPMIGSFGDAWTSQVMYLGDNYNVVSANPNFADEFTAGTAKYATTPEGLQSFQKLADVKDYYNGDYLAATFDDGVDMLANAEGAHWVMLSQVLGNIYDLYPENISDIGVFGIPGENADDHGLTVWMPNGVYGNKNSEHVDAVVAFMEFYITEEALDLYTEHVLPDGPFCIKGYELPDNAYDAVRIDMQSYFDAGKTITALEFQTSVKGPNCENICVEVGSGQIDAAEAAAAYDDDCKKQALQLGLDWD